MSKLTPEDRAALREYLTEWDTLPRDKALALLSALEEAEANAETLLTAMEYEQKQRTQQRHRAEKAESESAALRARLAEVEALKHPLMQCGRHGHATCPECWDGMAEENKTLRAEVERMRGALRTLLMFHGADDATLEEMAAPDYREAVKRARAALSGGSEEGESHGE